VVIQAPNGNRADRIIKRAVQHRKQNGEKYDRYQVDFYSKGKMKLLDLPEKVMGLPATFTHPEDGVLLDTAKNSILYLSETISEVTYQRPDKFKEIIKASKVSGNDQGYSYNTAQEANFDFYSPYLSLLGGIISPLSNQTFGYYKFRLEQTFESNDQQIYKIRVTPKRNSEPTVQGLIYIVDGTWEIYAVDLTASGTSMGQPLIDSLCIQQQYVYAPKNEMWIKQTQRLETYVSLLRIKALGEYTHVFNNYRFVDDFDKGTFNNTLVKIEKQSNSKSNMFWDQHRPVVLKQEEIHNYVLRDSIQQVRRSPAYLDSTDRVANRFRWSNVITGYTYRNKTEGYRIGYKLLNNLHRLSYNAVQGFVGTMHLDAEKTFRQTGSKTGFSSDISYGFSDQRVRFRAALTHLFDRRIDQRLTLFGGSHLQQYNPQDPIHPLVNALASLFFKENYIKLYQRDYLGLQYGQMITPQLKGAVGIEYTHRQPVFLHTNYSFGERNRQFTSNHPLDPNDYTSSPFATHRIGLWNMKLLYHPGQKIIDRPDGIQYIPRESMPTIQLDYNQGFASQHHFQHIEGSVKQQIPLNNKGTIHLYVKGGMFFNNDDMTFIDYKHFNGNEPKLTYIEGDIDRFMILPYYTQSTDSHYLETHFEYNMKGFLLNKIPVLSRLGFQELFGYHHFTVPGRLSYHEFNMGLTQIGWGKWRLLRIDYVQSHQGNQRNDGFVFRLAF
jgi:hypothetical protein